MNVMPKSKDAMKVALFLDKAAIIMYITKNNKLTNKELVMLP